MRIETKRDQQEKTLTPKEITLRVSQLKEELTASLLQNPSYLQSVGENLLNKTGSTFYATWNQDGVYYEVVRESEKNRKGRIKSGIITINVGGDGYLAPPNSVKLINIFNKGKVETHIETNSRGGGFSRDTEQTFRDARIVLKGLLP